jgi:hypothetical protein
MFKLFSNRTRLGVTGRKMQSSLTWLRDPLAHPDLDRMSTTELGDLPLSRIRCDCDPSR